MAIEHDAIPNADIHEPKGVSTASAGQVYIADGAGSGTWYNGTRSIHGCGAVVTNYTTSGLSTTYQEVNATTVGVTWVQNEISDDISFDSGASGGNFTIAVAGTYLITVNLQLQGVTAGDRHYAATFGVDSGSGIVAKDAFSEGYRSTDDATDTGSVTFTCLPTFTVGDKVYLMLKIDTGTVSELTVRHCNFTLHKVD